jgi:hypothetical protein
MYFSATPPRLRGIHGIIVVGISAGLLLVPTPAVAVSSITVSPSTAPAGNAVVISGTIPTTGSPSCPARQRAIPTSATTLFPPDGSGPPADRTAGGTFWVRYTVPNWTPASDYPIGVRCGGRDAGVHANLRVIDHVWRFATSAPQTGSSGASRSAERVRWRVIGGALIMGVGVFLAIAQLQPKGRRKV